MNWQWTEQALRGTRIASGQPCPYPGEWYCEDIPVGPHQFKSDESMPQVLGRDVIWFCGRSTAGQQPKPPGRTWFGSVVKLGFYGLFAVIFYRGVVLLLCWLASVLGL